MGIDSRTHEHLELYLGPSDRAHQITDNGRRRDNPKPAALLRRLTATGSHDRHCR